MTYEEAKAARDAIEARLKAASDTLKAIPGIGSGPMGLTPDHIKSSPEYREANRAYLAIHHELRRFNSAFTKQYRREIAAERRTKLG